jgi:hypothetical protein
MAADAKTRRPRLPASKPPSAPTTAGRPVPFEVVGSLSDEAIEALARLLLEIVEQEPGQGAVDGDKP